MSLSKILITGAAASGKSPFARLLKTQLERSHSARFPIVELSDGLIRRAAQEYAHLPGAMKASPSAWEHYIRQRKSDYREALLARGDQLQADSPGCLIREALDNGTLVVGLRRQAEGDWIRAAHWPDGVKFFWIHVIGILTVSTADRIDGEYFEQHANYLVNNRGGDALERAARDIGEDIAKRI